MKKEKKNNNFLKNDDFWLLVFLVLIISIGYYLYLQEETEFIVYKQECEEGSFNHDFYNDCIFLLMDYEDLMNMSMHNDFSRMCNLWAIKIGEIKTSCEKFERDSMLFENVSEDMFLDCWQMHNDEKCLINSRPNKSILILKKGLSISWLDLYCQVTSFSKCEDLECKNQKVYEYKCGDYFIELK